MTTNHDDSTPLTPNRRNVLLTATGLAAAALVGSSVADSSNVVQAQGKPTDSQISCLVEGLAPFDVLSFSWGMAIAVATGGGGGATGKVQFGQFSMAKNLDGQTPAIQLALAGGKHFPKATVTFAGAKGVATFSYEFTDVIFTSSQVSAAAGGGSPAESLSVAFDAVTMMHGATGYTWNADTNTGGPIL